MRQTAKSGDITIDYDAIAAVLTPLLPGERQYPAHVAAVVKAARRAAIDMAVEYRDTVDVFVIHATPSERMLAFYRRLGARVVTVDPGERTVLDRCRSERPWQMEQAAKRWYQRRRGGPAVSGPEFVSMPW